MQLWVALLRATALAPKPTGPAAAPAAFRCAHISLPLLPGRLDASAASDGAALLPGGLTVRTLR